MGGWVMRRGVGRLEGTSEEGTNGRGGGAGGGGGREAGGSAQQVVAVLLPSGCIDPTISLDVKY